jgi:hypothetical protein
MRIIQHILKVVAIFFLFAIMSSTSNVCGEEDLEKSGMSFALLFDCSSKGHSRICLEESFEEGLNVVLVGEKGICRALTGKTTTSEGYPNRPYGPDKITHLVGCEKCLAKEHKTNRFEEFRIAVVTADQPTVRLIPPKDDTFSVPKNIESKARRLATLYERDPSSYKSDNVGKGILDLWPKTLKAEKATLLIFRIVDFVGDPPENGPAVLLINDDFFRLPGSCISEPFFFSVNAKLHLAYGESTCCWRCGESGFMVHDLSTGKPRPVFSGSTSVD